MELKNLFIRIKSESLANGNLFYANQMTPADSSSSRSLTADKHFSNETSMAELETFFPFRLSTD